MKTATATVEIKIGTDSYTINALDNGNYTLVAAGPNPLAEVMEGFGLAAPEAEEMDSEQLEKRVGRLAFYAIYHARKAARTNA